MVTVQDVQTRFPEFSQYDGDRIALFIGDSELIMRDENRWLDFYDIALAYLTAHLIVVSQSTEVGDTSALTPIKKQEVDDTLVEMAVTAQPYDADMFASTSYGKTYLMYRRMVFAGIYGV